MDVGFADPDLDHSCRTRLGRQQAWGESDGQLARCLFELSALPCLADIALLPGRELVQQDQPGRYRIRSSSGVELLARAVATSGDAQPVPTSTKASLVIEAVTVTSHALEEEEFDRSAI